MFTKTYDLNYFGVFISKTKKGRGVFKIPKRVGWGGGMWRREGGGGGGGRDRRRGGGEEIVDTATTTTESDCDGPRLAHQYLFSSLLFFLFLAVSPNLQIWCMELVSEGLIFIEIFFNRWEIVKSLCIFCPGNLCFGDFQFAAVHGCVFCSNGYILRVGMSFHRFGS